MARVWSTNPNHHVIIVQEIIDNLALTFATVLTTYDNVHIPLSRLEYTHPTCCSDENIFRRASIGVNHNVGDVLKFSNVPLSDILSYLRVSRCAAFSFSSLIIPSS